MEIVPFFLNWGPLWSFAPVLWVIWVLCTTLRQSFALLCGSLCYFAVLCGSLCIKSMPYRARLSLLIDLLSNTNCKLFPWYFSSLHLDHLQGYARWLPAVGDMLYKKPKQLYTYVQRRTRWRTHLILLNYSPTTHTHSKTPQGLNDAMFIHVWGPHWLPFLNRREL